MTTTHLGKEYAAELLAEERASLHCLERIPAELFDWKPHEKSMAMGYLALLVAEIPKWIYVAIKTGEVDFATYHRFQPANTGELVAHFKETQALALQALDTISDEELTQPFYLKTGGQILLSSTKKETIRDSINHLVHHRGQLTVYMRLNDIPVPSIYGPSADDRSF